MCNILMLEMLMNEMLIQFDNLFWNIIPSLNQKFLNFFVLKNKTRK